MSRGKKTLLTMAVLLGVAGCASVDFERSLATTNQQAGDFTQGQLMLSQTPEQSANRVAAPSSLRSAFSALAHVLRSGSLPTVSVKDCIATLSPSVNTSGRKNARSTTRSRRSVKSHATIAHKMPPPMLQQSHGMRMRKLSPAVSVSG